MFTSIVITSNDLESWISDAPLPSAGAPEAGDRVARRARISTPAHAAKLAVERRPEAYHQRVGRWCWQFEGRRAVSALGWVRMGRSVAWLASIAAAIAVVAVLASPGRALAADPPTQPTNPQVSWHHTMGGIVAYVTWGPPASSSYPVTSYIIQAPPAGQWTVAGTVQHCYADYFTLGATYMFSVYATSAGGVSAPSIVVATVPDLAPAPRDFAASFVGVKSGYPQVHLSWQEPASDGGSPIQSYIVVLQSADGTFIESHQPGALARTYDLIFPTKMTPGVTYQFRVMAQTDVGNGLPAKITYTVPTVPGAPTGLVASFAPAGSGTSAATISWGPPQSDGGAPVSGYVVALSPAVQVCTPAGSSCVFAGLTVGSTYTVKIVASNGVGSGTAASITFQVPAATSTPSPSEPASSAAPASEAALASSPSAGSTPSSAPSTPTGSSSGGVDLALVLVLVGVGIFVGIVLAVVAVGAYMLGRRR
jgi:hypothetical protein